MCVSKWLYLFFLYYWTSYHIWNNISSVHTWIKCQNIHENSVKGLIHIQVHNLLILPQPIKIDDFNFQHFAQYNFISACPSWKTTTECLFQTSEIFKQYYYNHGNMGDHCSVNKEVAVPAPMFSGESGSMGTRAQKCPRVYPSAIGDFQQNDGSHNNGKYTPGT